MTMRKLIESIDAIEEAESNEFDTFKGVTVANGESFLTDIATAFGGLKGQKLNIEVTLKGTNMLAYRITRVETPKQ